jgi:hypothetical protein
MRMRLRYALGEVEQKKPASTSPSRAFKTQSNTFLDDDGQAKQESTETEEHRAISAWRRKGKPSQHQPPEGAECIILHMMAKTLIRRDLGGVIRSTQIVQSKQI